MIQARSAVNRQGPGNRSHRQGPLRTPPIVMIWLALCAGILLIAGPASAQTRDHLTDQETELVRFYQELDKRIEVFIKAMDRRFAIINGRAQTASKKLMKDEPEWGDLPKGTRTELLGDIAGILDEAITNIDDVSRRDEKNPLISRSLRKLTVAANGYLAQIAVLKNQAKDVDEQAAIERVADNANQIIEVGAKLPPPPAESDKKKKKP
jgi:hypothetical protein